MAHQNVLYEKKHGIPKSWIVIVILLVLLGLSGYLLLHGVADMIAPETRKCDVCAKDTSKWYAVSFRYTDSSGNSNDDENHRIAPYTLCPECALGVKGHVAWMREQSIRD